MNATFIIGVLLFVILIVFVIGAIQQSWAQRKDANLPRALTWAGSGLVIVFFLGAFVYGAVSIANYGGTFVNNALNGGSSAPALPNPNQVEVPRVGSGR